VLGHLARQPFPRSEGHLADDRRVLAPGQLHDQFVGLSVENHEGRLLRPGQVGGFLEEGLEQGVAVENGADAALDLRQSPRRFDLLPQFLTQDGVLDRRGGLVAEGEDQLLRLAVEGCVQHQQQASDGLAEEERKEGGGAHFLRETRPEQTVVVPGHHGGAFLHHLADDVALLGELEVQNLLLRAAEGGHDPERPAPGVLEEEAGSLHVEEDGDGVYDERINLVGVLVGAEIRAEVEEGCQEGQLPLGLPLVVEAGEEHFRGALHNLRRSREGAGAGKPQLAHRLEDVFFRQPEFGGQGLEEGGVGSLLENPPAEYGGDGMTVNADRGDETLQAGAAAEETGGVSPARLLDHLVTGAPAELSPRRGSGEEPAKGRVSRLGENLAVPAKGGEGKARHPGE